MSENKSYLKSFHDLVFQSPYRYKPDLLNEVLYVLIDQEVAKISEVKVGVKKMLTRLDLTLMILGSADLTDFFYL